MTKILAVTAWVPTPRQYNGYTLRVFPILQHLAANYNVTNVVCGDTRADAPRLAQSLGGECGRILLCPTPTAGPFGRRLRLARALVASRRSPWEEVISWDEDYLRFLRTVLAKDRYSSVLLLHGSDLASLVLGQETGGARIVYDWIDSPSILASRRAMRLTGWRGRLGLWRVERLKRWERELNARLDASIYIAEPDRDMANPPGGEEKVFVVPNGVLQPPPAFSARRPGSGPPTIGFLGNLAYPPNWSAALRLHDRIYRPLRERLPGLCLKLIGRHPGPRIQAFRSGSVEVTGAVESIWPHLAQVDVMVFPMEVGGGLQNKILESMAAGCPIVTTSVSALGCGRDAMEAMTVADSDEGLRSAISQLLGDEELWLERQARGLEVIGQFSWDAILPRYERIVLG